MKKRYIEKDEAGNIIGVLRHPRYPGQPFLAHDDAEIEEYYGKIKDKRQKREMVTQRAEKNITDQAISELKSEGKLPPDYKLESKEA